MAINKNTKTEKKEAVVTDRPSSAMHIRIKLVVPLIIAVFVVWIIYNMVQTAVVKSDEFREYANAQQLKSKIVEAPRGTIYDASGSVLARSATVYTVYIDPKTLAKYLENLNDSNLAAKVNKEGVRVYATFDEICLKLSQLLEIDLDTVKQKAVKNSQYEILKKNVEKTVVDEIWAYLGEHKINAVNCQSSEKRFYSQNELASNVIGHLDYDGNGIYGLEAYYENYLAGIDGRTVYASDRDGQEIPYEYKQSDPAQAGNSLYLNLDMTIQSFLEKALNESTDLNIPNERACAIIMNPKTGAVLAMATSRGYDLNNPAEIYDKSMADIVNAISDEKEQNTAKLNAWSTQWKNKAISELYFPGSVFKVITGSAALEEGSINLTQTFNCTTSYKVSDTNFNCWTSRAHGSQTFAESMIHSCNPAFIQIGQALGAEQFSNYFKAYGFTEKTGIDLPAEANSLFVKYDNMGPVELASSAFGQTNKVTPLQMITAYAACVNGGYLVTPQVVDKIVDSDTGNVIKDFDTSVRRQVISEKTSKTMREILFGVVETETGSNSYIQGYKIGGKSGTSQKIDIDRTGRTYVASYCGFAPADDPEVIMLVMVDDPTGGRYYGSQVAAPIVVEVFENILPYLGLFPEYSEDELKEIAVDIVNVEQNTVDSATKTIKDLGLEVNVIGEGSKVVKQVPSSGTVSRGCTVVLYTEEDYKEEFTTVPNLSGLSLSEVEARIESAGLNYLPTGSAVYKDGAISSSQNYVSGNEVAKGTIIQVGFVEQDVASQ
ncbi:MAG: PASTA domain-containing protein, partial [Clostridiales bacterium]|nr:PASTA domain-containing protein [Clostridiales bacterium]